MYYRVGRTYITDAEGRSVTSADPRPYLVAANSAAGAVTIFLETDKSRMMGGVSELQGDKATATAMRTDDRRVFVIFVERAAESIREGQPPERPEAER
jgi:hypothetical protein